MTLKQLDINGVRRLLTLYYAGESTPQQEAQLSEFFCNCNPALIPDDLKAEQAFFAAVRSSQPPVGLEDRILNATCGKKSRRFGIRLVKAISIAASLAVIALVGAKMMNRSTSDSQSSGITLTADALRDSATECHTGKVLLASSLNADTSAGAISETQATVQTSEASTSATKDASMARGHRRPAAKRSSYKEITDTATAVHLVASVDRMLRNTFSNSKLGVKATQAAVKEAVKDAGQVIKDSRAGIATTREVINSVEETIKDISL
mgnify:CR=1 FL=1